MIVHLKIYSVSHLSGFWLVSSLIILDSHWLKLKTASHAFGQRKWMQIMKLNPLVLSRSRYPFHQFGQHKYQHEYQLNRVVQFTLNDYLYNIRLWYIWLSIDCNDVAILILSKSFAMLFNKNYYVVRNARCPCSRYTLRLTLIFLINKWMNECINY